MMQSLNHLLPLKIQMCVTVENLSDTKETLIAIHLTLLTWRNSSPKAFKKCPHPTQAIQYVNEFVSSLEQI